MSHTDDSYLPSQSPTLPEKDATNAGLIQIKYTVLTSSKLKLQPAQLSTIQATRYHKTPVTKDERGTHTKAPPSINATNDRSDSVVLYSYVHYSEGAAAPLNGWVCFTDRFRRFLTQTFWACERNVECGMWNVECGMWNVELRCGM